jgi:hypothetical protein
VRALAAEDIELFCSEIDNSSSSSRLLKERRIAGEEKLFLLCAVRAARRNSLLAGELHPFGEQVCSSSLRELKSESVSIFIERLLLKIRGMRTKSCSLYEDGFHYIMRLVKFRLSKKFYMTSKSRNISMKFRWQKLRV